MPLALTQYRNRDGEHLPRRWDGTLAYERDWHRVGAHAVARDAAGGMAGAGFRMGAVIPCPRWGWRRGATVDLPYVLQDDL